MIFLKGKNNSRTTSESTCTSDLPEQQETSTENSDEPNNTCTCPSSASGQSQTRNQDGDSNIAETENQTVKERGDEGTVKEGDDEGLTVTAEMLEETEEDEGIEEDEEEEEDDDDGWITPSNITSLKQKMSHADQERVAVCVGCVTTDFAMQVPYLGLICIFFSNIDILKRLCHHLNDLALPHCIGRMFKIYWTNLSN